MQEQAVQAALTAQPQVVRVAQVVQVLVAVVVGQYRPQVLLPAQVAQAGTVLIFLTTT